jgi:uncharacterized membrane protein (UPF0127 family)
MFRGVVFVLALAGLVILFAFAFRSRDAGKRVPTLSIAEKVSYFIEVRDEPFGQARGLSGRSSLADDQAMLFVYDTPATLSFWMKDMNFPLDFVWIRDFTVVAVNENIPHPAANGGETYRLASPVPADMVLEINAGQIEYYGIEIGDEVDLQLK